MSWVTARYTFPPSRRRPSGRMSTGPFTSARPSTASARSSAETSLSEQVRAEQAKLLSHSLSLSCSAPRRAVCFLVLFSLYSPTSSSSSYPPHVDGEYHHPAAVSVRGQTHVHDRRSRRWPQDVISFPRTFTYIVSDRP